MEDVALPSNQTYCWGWQKTRESTGSLALGIHFSHYMAGTFNPEILIIRTSFSYDHRKKGINVMIEKSTGDFNMEKLHIILLFEADFNANNKWISHVVMY